MSDDRRRYLEQFVAKAAKAALPARAPGATYVALAPIARDSHISLSVAAHQIQVNLNNDKDIDRKRIERLAADKDAIHAEIGEGLLWDQKDGRKKTVIRATRDSGYADADWEAQHRWALAMLKAFTKTFGARLS